MVRRMKTATRMRREQSTLEEGRLFSHQCFSVNILRKMIRDFRSVLMDSSLKNFQKMLDSAGEFMKDEIEKLPLNKYE